MLACMHKKEGDFSVALIVTGLDSSHQWRNFHKIGPSSRCHDPFNCSIFHLIQRCDGEGLI